ncbi:TonB-dependent siderophore receptor [Paraglaciecola aquimarina]|uniref:TonB-dependent siderophore receptor n=1 Tax=Paraglaciecola algarum TaxID=3050085 RepID=A0ABS9D6E4_9ALTE|nr:TonB-dependent siderophore receptor [Paraglaciecola sp. G1-23]MCF2948002.1 TonB-dependent siderophore receptor [Paraglaciecola sp. G1-23]
MKNTRTFVLSSLLLAMGFQAYAQENKNQANAELNDEQIEKIKIVGVRQNRVSQGATGLTMEIDETPQSISLVSADLIENFAANDLNDALKLATGITVEEWETNRTQYTSRGFELKSTQIDGVGLPNDWGIVTGAMEAYGYEEIEVIRGANGILTGVGNAAGTINYVRKRPTNENQGNVGVSLGSWDFKRLQADYSVLLTESGSWAARVVAVTEDKGSYLDGLKDDRVYLYGVVDGQLTDNATLTLGLSYQDANTDGNMWGGLTFNYADGSPQAEWDVGASPTLDWTMWDTINTTAFVEYVYLFANDWQVKATFNRQNFEAEDKLHYAYDPYGQFNSETNLGLYSYPGRYDDDYTADLLDVTTIGSYQLFGQEHEVTLGVSHATSDKLMYVHPIDFAVDFAPAPAFPWALDAIAEPDWGDKEIYSDMDVTFSRLFGSTKINFTDSLFVVAGFNGIKYNRKGHNSGVIIDEEASEISPYFGVTYGITDNINAYASYSDIYQPQEQTDFDGVYLAPTKGLNYELGIKAQMFDDKLLATFAVFSAEQDNLSKFAGFTDAGQYAYQGINVESKGFEFELTGKLTEYLSVVLGYTNLDVEDENDEKEHLWAARDLVNYSVEYSFPHFSELIVGIGGKWQSKIQNAEQTVQQSAYLLVNAFARWDISDSLSVQANVNNITNEKYINSLTTVGFYGAPINGSLGLTYAF